MTTNDKNLTLYDALELDIVTFTFTKTMGSSRIASGTRNLILIPKSAHPKGTGSRAPNPDILVFFDWHKQQWRSCKKSSIFGTWEITNDNLIQRIKEYERKGLTP